MKKFILYTFLFAIISSFASCRKEDNPILPDLIRVPTPLILKVGTTDQSISAQDPASFKGSFTVDLYFKDDIKPQKFDVVMIKNGDKANVKTLQQNVTTFPTTVEITGNQLQTLFGAPVVLGDKFDVGVNVTTQSGQTYLAFPLVGQSHASGVAAQPGASTSIRYEAVCKFNVDDYVGEFEVIQDEWEDYSPGETVELTKVNETTLSFKYRADNAQPILLKVNPNTNQVSVAEQVYGTYSWGTQYGNFSVQSVASLENNVAPCEGTIGVRLQHTVSAGSFGEYTIVLKKK